MISVTVLESKSSVVCSSTTSPAAKSFAATSVQPSDLCSSELPSPIAESLRIRSCGGIRTLACSDSGVIRRNMMCGRAASQAWTTSSSAVASSRRCSCSSRNLKPWTLPRHRSSPPVTPLCRRQKSGAGRDRSGSWVGGAAHSRRRRFPCRSSPTRRVCSRRSPPSRAQYPASENTRPRGKTTPPTVSAHAHDNTTRLAVDPKQMLARGCARRFGRTRPGRPRCPLS